MIGTAWTAPCRQTWRPLLGILVNFDSKSRFQFRHTFFDIQIPCGPAELHKGICDTLQIRNRNLEHLQGHVSRARWQRLHQLPERGKERQDIAGMTFAS